MSISIKWHGPSVSKDPEATYAADVLSFVIAQRTSRFHKAMVESGLAYAVNLGYQTLDHTGPIALFAQTSAENYAACSKALLDEVAKMTDDDYFTNEQLENAKNILAVDEQYGRERASQYVHTVGYWWAVAGLDYYLDYVDSLRKVTRRDIKKYLTDYVIGKPYVMGVLVSPEQRRQIGL